ncbi:MAG: ergothioneine biosynthesis protein EgtB [Methylococcaceae bacterium]
MTKKLLGEKYQAVRRQTTELTLPLTREDMVVQPIVDVSPPKWHLAHTTWFFETFLLLPHLPKYQAFHPHYSFLFNSYYESVGDRAKRNHRGFMTRPTVQEIMDYRRYIDGFMEDLIDRAGEDLLFWVELGLNHEQQHQELLVTDIKYILGTQVVKAEYSEKNVASDKLPSAAWIPVDGGLYSIGHTGSGFCFDNELGRHKVHIEPFQIADRVISVEEYQAFMNDDGYQRAELWLSDGRDWLQHNNCQSPLYWEKIDHEWHYYRLDGFDQVSPNEPITHISFFEADAFARWSGKRLPTEFEWEIASQEVQPNGSKSAHFLERGLFHPIYDAHQAGFCGSVWEWTRSAYSPYPGYQQTKGALGEYNGKFMVNQMVLRGGSCATPASHFRLSYRNFFQPDKQWQFTGIRLAETIK